MFVRRFVIVLSLTAIVAELPPNQPLATVSCPQFRVLETGQFHGEEVTAKTGEHWLGLRIDGDRSTLLPYTLTIETVHDPLVDEKDQKTGAKVSVDLPLEPRFLVQGGNMLNEGPAKTVYEGGFEDGLTAKQPLSLKLGDVGYELKIIAQGKAEKCETERMLNNGQLILSSGERTQVLYTLEECGNDPTWYVIWAGDLDNDGKLDLYVSVNQHYNVSERKLFLSSLAAEKDLVHQAAEFVISGC